MVNEMNTDGDPYDMCMGGFILENTLSENGTVTRGVCDVNPDGTLKDVTETYDIERRGNGIFAMMSRETRLLWTQNSMFP